MNGRTIIVRLPIAGKLFQPYDDHELEKMLRELEDRLIEITRGAKILKGLEVIRIEMEWIYPSNIRMVLGKFQSDSSAELLAFIEKEIRNKIVEVDDIMRNALDDHKYDTIKSAYEDALKIVVKEQKKTPVPLNK